MNILGEGFPAVIVEQVATRQRIAGSGFNNSRPNSALEYYSSRTAWGKLISSVNLTENKGFRYSGDALAKKYVLFNGVVEKLKDGPVQRAGVNDGSNTAPAYGIGSGATGNENEMGQRPMPGITNIKVKSENRGSLRTGEITIKAWSRQDFEIIDALYLRVGYSLLLEWGWSMYYGKGQQFISSPNDSLEDEFLAGKYDYQEMLVEIQKKRLASAGNYDAMFGKIVNFNWSFQEDGSYNITVIMKSVGDVIESLKINGLTLDVPEPVDPGKEPPPTPDPNPPADPPEEKPDPTSEEIILEYGSKHSIGTMFYAAASSFIAGQMAPVGHNGILTKDVEGQISTIKDSGYILGNSTGKTTGTVDFVRQTFEGETTNSTPNNQYYVRLGSFLDFLQYRVMMSVEKDAKKTRILNIDTDIESNLMLKVTNQISADPRICQFRATFSDNSTIMGPGEDAVVRYGNNTYLKIMNIYVNFVFILNKLEELKDDKGKVGLIDLLDGIVTAICNATGDINYLNWSVDEIENRAFVVDQTAAPDRDIILKHFGKSIRLANFNVYGYYGGKDAGFIRNMSMKTEITPDMATMITVGAQSGGYVVGEDATGLSVLNKGFKDRIKPSVVEAVAAEQTKQETPDEQFPNASKNYSEFLRDISYTTNPVRNAILNQEKLDSYPNTLVTFLEYQTAKKAATEKKASPKTGFLPFNLSLTMDGLSGMKIYNKFIVDTSYLPSNYPTALEFVIKGINHEISNNDWKTNIESFAIVKDPFAATGKEIPPSTERRPPSNGPGPGGPSTWVPPGPPAPPSGERDQYYIQYNPGQLGSAYGNSSPVAKAVIGQGFGNGKIPSKNLVYPGTWNGSNFSVKNKGVKFLLWPTAARAFSNWQYDIWQQFGYTILFNSAYRTYERQVANAGSAKAAKAGRSAHGMGIAMDLDFRDKNGKSIGWSSTNGISNYYNALKNGKSGEVYRKVAPIAYKYKIVLPWRMRQAGVQAETWHWEYWGSPYFSQEPTLLQGKGQTFNP